MVGGTRQFSLTLSLSPGKQASTQTADSLHLLLWAYPVAAYPVWTKNKLLFLPICSEIHKMYDLFDLFHDF